MIFLGGEPSGRQFILPFAFLFLSTKKKEKKTSFLDHPSIRSVPFRHRAKQPQSSSSPLHPPRLLPSLRFYLPDSPFSSSLLLLLLSPSTSVAGGGSGRLRGRLFLGMVCHFFSFSRFLLFLILGGDFGLCD